MHRATDEITREAAQVWQRSVRARVFVAEDDPALRNLVVSALLDDGHEVYEAANGEELLRLLGASAHEIGPAYGIDLVVLDHRMPVVKGLAIVRKLRQAQWLVPFILMTAFPSDELISEAHALDVHVLAKPFSLRDLTQSALSLLLTESREFPRLL